MNRPLSSALARVLLLAIAVCVLGAARPAAAQTVRYLAFGDSITEGVGSDRTPPGYPAVLERLLKREGVDAQVINAGLASEDSTEGLSRISGVLSLGGKAVLLMEGTNDVTKMAEGIVSIETVIANLDQMARRAQAKKIQPIHATIIPRAKFARYDRSNVLTINLVWAIRQLAIDSNRGLVDTWEVYDITNRPDSFETLYSHLPEDTIGHPNDDGYDLLGQAFADVLLGRDTVPPVLGVFEPFFRQTTIPADSKFSATLYEPRDAAGIDLDATFLLINGRVVAGVDSDQSNRRKAVLTHSGPEGVGCRAEVLVRSQDRNDPPNTFERLLSLYDVEGRKVLPGDVDFDCFVDGNDLTILGLYFGAEDGDPRYFTRYDFNRDGVIDGRDLAQLAKNFGRNTE
jgi:lysophospholipase L1-like esterase